MPKHGGGRGGNGAAPQLDARSFGGRALKPTFELTKSVGYVASGTNSNQVLSLSQTDASDAVKAGIPNAVVVKNTGIIPMVAMFVYEEYSDDDTDEGQATMQTILMPGEEVEPPIRGAIREAGNNPLYLLDGTVVDFTTTLGDTSNTMADFESDSGDNIASGELNNTTDPVVFEIDNDHEKYRVGDYLRVENEIIRVEGTYDDNPTTSVVADGHIVVSRGHLGSTTASHAGTPDIMFPCTNELYDFDRALSGSSQLVQSDMGGAFKNSNFFGYGRTEEAADNKTFGIVAGSVCFRFYSSAYMDIPMGGTGVAGGTGGSYIPITSSTSSQLSTSTEYSLNLIIDDSAETTVSFTTSSSNVNFGGSEGIIQKLNDAILTATRTAGNNLFGYSCTVGIVNSKLRFTSNSHLSPHDGTNGSRMEVKDGAGGTNVLTGAAGIFPDINNSIAPVKPIIAPVSVYDSLTYAKSANMSAICYDNGFGNLIYGNQKVGTINYETGAFEFRIPSLPNAEFEIQLAHGTPFAGKLDNAKEDSNVLVAVHANVINKNLASEVSIKVY